MYILFKKNIFTYLILFYGVFFSSPSFSMDNQEDNLSKINLSKLKTDELWLYNVEVLNKLDQLTKAEAKIKKNVLNQEKAQLSKVENSIEKKYKKQSDTERKKISKEKEKRTLEYEQSEKHLEIIQKKFQILNTLDNLYNNSMSQTLNAINSGKEKIDVKSKISVIEKKQQTTWDNVLDHFDELEESNGVRIHSFDKISCPLYCGLSMDGGGTRGLIVALYLQKIEELSGKRISELFDYVGGTSVGGIIGLGLVAGEGNIPYYNAAKFVELFSQKSHIIFPKSSNEIHNIGYDIMGMLWSSRYSEVPLTNILKEYFKDLTLGHAIKPVLVTAVNINSYEDSKVCTFESIKAVSNPNDNFLMRDVARATSAAPTYFPAAKIRNISQNTQLALVDGGLWVNNPAQLVYNRMIKLYNCKNDELMMLSLGTGKVVQQGLKVLPANTGKIRAIPAVIDTLMTSSSDGVDSEMLNLLGPQHYYRIQSSLTQNVDLDESSQDIMEVLENSAVTQYRKLKPLTRFLLKNYDAKKDFF